VDAAPDVTPAPPPRARVVGFDGTALLPPRAGVGNYLARLLRALVAVDRERAYLLYSKAPLGALEPALAGVGRPAGHFPPSYWLWTQAVLPGVIRRSRADVCHYVNGLAPLRHPGPFVFTVHDLSLFRHPRHHPWSRLLTVRVIFRVAVKRAAALVAVSEFTRRELLDVLGPPPAKVHVVYEAAPEEFGPAADPAALAALRRRYALPESFVLSVGTLEPRKNLFRLLRAFRAARDLGADTTLVLAGPPGWRMARFQPAIRALGLADRVRCVGYVPEADLRGLYAAATVLAYPSLYEGFGLPVVEAMACGTPVLSSAGTALAEVCGEAAVLVDPEDEHAIAQGLARLLRDRALRQDLRERGLARAATFSWRRAARQVLGVYDEILGRAAR
jgi:glycosyltransferase involved in cell wall biosynthesis